MGDHKGGKEMTDQEKTQKVRDLLHTVPVPTEDWGRR